MGEVGQGSGEDGLRIIMDEKELVDNISTLAADSKYHIHNV